MHFLFAKNGPSIRTIGSQQYSSGKQKMPQMLVLRHLTVNYLFYLVQLCLAQALGVYAEKLQ